MLLLEMAHNLGSMAHAHCAHEVYARVRDGQRYTLYILWPTPAWVSLQILMFSTSHVSVVHVELRADNTWYASHEIIMKRLQNKAKAKAT